MGRINSSIHQLSLSVLATVACGLMSLSACLVELFLPCTHWQPRLLPRNAAARLAAVIRSGAAPSLGRCLIVGVWGGLCHFFMWQEGFGFSLFCHAGKKERRVHARAAVSVRFNAGDAP